jgi:redox-sensitive bicupin YhaK (pirin superfamily)
MIIIRKSQDRGHANHGWLDSYHSFSFAEYYDPAYMGYSVLRVINDDRIDSSSGFGKHPHRDMEIITYMLAGELRHQDSMGNGSVIGAGDVQRMTAGTGIRHSEFNASTLNPVHLLQIWVLPSQNNLIPSYEEKHFADVDKENRWRLIVSPNGHDGSITINQDAYVYASLLVKSKVLSTTLNPNRCTYLQVARGTVVLDGKILSVGDAAMIEAIEACELLAVEDSELILFDLPTFN